MADIPTSPPGNTESVTTSDWATSTPSTSDVSLKAAHRSQFEEQCFLMQFYDQIHNRVGDNNGQSPNTLAFKKFSRLMATPSTIKEVLGKLTRREELSRYLKAIPAEQAALVPVISIRKIYKGIAGIFSKEIKFEDYTKIDSIMSTKEARGHGAGIISFNYVHDSTTPGNSMVMKCKIKFYFQSIDVFLNEWTDGFEPDTNNPAKVSYLDLVNMDTRLRGQRAEIQGLLGPPLNPDATAREVERRKELGAQLRKASLNNYEIKAFVGWNTTRKHLEQLAAGSDDLYDSVMNTGYAIRLNLHNHQIDFQEDGSIMLSTDWVGAIESKMNSPIFDILRLTEKDILGVDQRSEALADDQRQIDLMQANAEKFVACRQRERTVMEFAEDKFRFETTGKGPPTRYADPEACHAATIKAGQIENSGAAVHRIDKAVTDTLLDTVRYSKFFDAFREKLTKITDTSAGFAKNRLFFIDVPKRYIEVSEQEIAGGGTPDSAGNRFDAALGDAFFEENLGFATSEGTAQLQAIQERINEQVSVSNSANMSAEDRARSQAEAVSGGTPPDATMIETLAQFAGIFVPAAAEAVVADDKRIYWFYFGDLLDTAMEVINKEKVSSALGGGSLEDMSILLGPVAYINPAAAATGGGSPQTKVINLADIPVSLNLFVRWWLEVCVIPKRPKFPLREFIVRATTDLAGAALGRNCYPPPSAGVEKDGFARKRSELTAAVKVGFSVVDIPKMVQNGKYQPKFLPGKSYFVNTMPKMHAASYEDDLSSLFLIYVYQDMIVSPTRVGDRIEDEKAGVYHLTHGRDRGIVHKMSFSRDQHPAQQAGHIQNAADNTDPNGMVIAQFGGPYDCKVTTFGCSAFAPGQFVYIKPTMLYAGLRNGESFTTETIRMEGYYHINKVEGIIEGGKYETILDCKYQYPAADPDSSVPISDGIPIDTPTLNEPRPNAPPPNTTGGAS